MNLVAPSTLAADLDPPCRRLAPAPAALRRTRDVWVDLGSGAGFPGLVDRLRAAEHPGAHVHLVESNRQEGRVPARGRARDRCAGDRARTGGSKTLRRSSGGSVDVVTARALAPLAELLGYGRAVR